MAHRAKTNSRRGCQDCKRRHRKCDESRPSCLTCRISGRSCSYLTQLPEMRPAVPTAASTRPAGSPPTARLSGPLDAISAGAAANVSPSPFTKADEPIFTLRHMELLYHLRTHLLHHHPTGISFGLRMDDYFDLAIRQAFRSPWLMQQILAVSAAHLSFLRDGDQNPNPLEASILQTRGLALLKRAETGLSAADGLPACFFSVFVSLQAMSEALSVRSSLPELLTRLCGWLHLARGIAFFIGRYPGPLLVQMQAPEGDGCVKDPNKAPADDEKITCDQFAHLMMYIETGCLDHVSVTACKQAADSLHNLYHCVTSRNATPTEKLFFAVQWAISTSPKYIQLIEKRCRGALVVLAHYGLLLYHARHYWAIGDSGQFMIESIAQYLGEEGAEQIVWLKETMRTAD